MDKRVQIMQIVVTCSERVDTGGLQVLGFRQMHDL